MLDPTTRHISSKLVNQCKKSQLDDNTFLSSTSQFNTSAWPWLEQLTALTCRIFLLAESLISSKTWRRASNVGSHISLWKLVKWRASTRIASTSFWKAFFFSDARTRYLLAIVDRGIISCPLLTPTWSRYIWKHNISFSKLNKVPTMMCQGWTLSNKVMVSQLVAVTLLIVMFLQSWPCSNCCFNSWVHSWKSVL